MKVLVACEFSGIVRDAFIARGHDAVSCDLLPTERPGPHFQGDVLSLLGILETSNPVSKKPVSKRPVSIPEVPSKYPRSFDLAIEHPPCDHLAVSGARWFERKRKDGSQRKAIEFFLDLWNVTVPRIAIENPIGIMSGKREYLKKWFPDLYERAKSLPKPQIIQPWMFGHGEIKATCLWLKNLPKLVPTDVVEGRAARVHREPPGPDRWKNRSRTYSGIAAAMADQWGCLK